MLPDFIQVPIHLLLVPQGEAEDGWESGGAKTGAENGGKNVVKAPLLCQAERRHREAEAEVPTGKPTACTPAS